MEKKPEEDQIQEKGLQPEEERPDIWKSIRDDMKTSLISPHLFRMWIKDLIATISDDGQLVLECPNLFTKNRVNNHYLKKIKELLKKHRKDSDPTKVLLFAEKSDEIDDPKTVSAENARQLPLLNNPGATTSNTGLGRLVTKLKKEFTFARLSTIESNKFAINLVREAIRGKSKIRSIFLLGFTGNGKSHLMQAAAHELTEEGKKVLYVDANTLMVHFSKAGENGDSNTFKASIREYNYLFLDNIHLLSSGAIKTQQEIMLLVDDVLNKDGVVIFGSELPPIEIKGFKKALLSRFAEGIAEISESSFEDRLVIAELIAEEDGIALSAEVVECLARSLTKDIRQFVAATVCLTAKQRLVERHIDITDAKAYLNFLDRGEKLDIDLIKKVVAEKTGVKESQLFGKRRGSKNVSEARHVAVFFAYELIRPELSLTKIGKAFGGRRHGTISHSIATVKKRFGDEKNHYGFLEMLKVTKRAILERTG